jgi:hypothetical protein
MNRLLFFTILIAFNLKSFGQKTPSDFGYTHLTYNYKGDKVDILVKSKKGEENNRKPLFFWCQGSLPQPLIKIDENGAYGVFPFNPDSLSIKYHLVVVGKPYIPLIYETKNLSNNFMYLDSTTGKFTKEYSERNLLDYYVNRNIEIIKYLRKQNWVSNEELVVAGHSEGSTIAAKMAYKSSIITSLIYSGGNPMGRIMSMILQNRAVESDTDSTRYTNQEFEYWQYVVNNKFSMDYSQGDTPKATYGFSDPPIEYIEKLKIPILISYGTKDYCSPFNDYMHIDFIRKGKLNVQFLTYIGTEHNYFPLTYDNRPNYDIFNWDRVANDWLKWLNDK